MSTTDVATRPHAPAARSWAMARHRIRDDAAATLLLWAIYFTGVLAFSLIVAWFGELEGSIWDSATGLVRWYAGAVGAYLTAVYLPLYITHGRTRGAFLRQTPVVIGAFVLLLSVLMTAGYAIEQVVYGIGGWPHHLDSSLRFDDGVRYGATFALFVCEYAVWTVGGALAGAAFYRSAGHGFVMVPVLLAMLGAFAVVSAETMVPPLAGLFDAIGVDPTAAGVPTVAAVSAVLVAGAATLMWSFARDQPVRPRSA